MANVTRIKAKDEKTPEEKGDEQALAKSEKTKKVENKKPKTTKKAVKAKKVDKKDAKPKKQRKIFAPFRYVRDSWREIRQVRWPDRKSAWKMTLSVIIYVVIFGAVIMLLDAFFTFIFNLILGE
ncbi:MAG: preprotein translocase subunit SecE [Candidatus Nomurabacteria bacterium]|nr:preprotein translocase subunit SecE [Candidatus Nomurabacteria bacterium]